MCRWWPQARLTEGPLSAASVGGLVIFLIDQNLLVEFFLLPSQGLRLSIRTAPGVPTASSFFVGMVAFSTAAQADIACWKLGCRETGRTLRRNGSYYRGLGLPAG